MAVALNWTSDMSKVAKDLDMAQRKVVTLEEKLKNVTKESKNNENSFKATFEGGLGQLKGMVSGYLSLSGAVSLVNAGLAEQKRISQEIHRVQMTAADAQAEVVKNLGNVSTEQASKFLKEVEGIAQKSGAPSVAPVYMAAAATISAVAGNEGLTKNILAESVPLFKNKLDELPQFAGAVGDLATIAGASSREQIRGIIGLVLTTQTQARITSLDAFKNAAPALAATAAVDTGKDRIRALKEGGALFAAIGGAIKDPEGALTKTATSEVATALNDLLPEKDVFSADGELKRKGTGLKTLGERLAVVQGDINLQRRFWETGEGMQAASFRGPIQPVIRQLIGDKDSEAANRFRGAMTSISADPNVTKQILTNLGSATPQLALAATSKASMGSIESFQLGSGLGTQAQARKTIGETLDQTRTGITGFLGLDKQVSSLTFEGMQGIAGSTEAAIGVLRGKERSIRQPFGTLGSAAMGAAGLGLLSGVQRPESMLSAGEKEMIALLRDQIRILEESKAAQEKANAAPNIGGTAAAARDLQLNREGR